jgi:hypothetical protein
MQLNLNVRGSFRFSPGRIARKGQVGQTGHSPPRKPRAVRHRPLRCDCGQIAVTVLTVRVGSDPQYTIHLPLCHDCFALEQDYRCWG